MLYKLLPLYLKLMNSVVVAGLYYGFLTSFSVGPSYLFLIRARLIEKGTEKKIAATTGFITGQLMMFISIYYAPLHLALSRPHTITALTLPYLLFNFFDKNDKHYYSDSGYMLDSGYKNQNSMRKFSVYKVFFNNLVFQLLNPVFFSSSILIRLVNIYLFRCNNKLLFLTSSFVGWLIGHIFLTNCIGLILVWLQQHNLMKSKVTVRFDKYIMLKIRNYADQIFPVFSFMILLYYLGRIPIPYFFTNEIAETRKQDETREKVEIDIEIDSETDETKHEYNKFLEEDHFSEKIQEETDVIGFQNSFVTSLFDFQRWNRPLRYIKNDHFENFVRNENSQFYFHILQSDGKERISFTYPPNLSTFLKIMEKKMDLFTRDKTSDNELSNSWSSTNNEKRKKLSNEFFKRAKVLDKKFRPLDVLENRIRVCNDQKKKKYLPKIYDPFLNGRFRGEIQKSFSPFIQNETYTTNSILINKIHSILLSSNSNSPEFDQKKDPFDQKSVFTEIGFFFNLMSKFSEKSVSSLNFDRLYLFPEHEHVKRYSEEKKRKKKFLFDAIRTDLNDETIFDEEKCIGINEISKKVPRWSYKLLDELEQLTENTSKEAQIRSRHAERILVFNSKTENKTEDWNTWNLDNTDDNEIDESSNDVELPLLKYSREPDFAREIIRGSMRAQRRKIVTWEFFQSHPHSPLFLGKIKKSQFFWGDLFHDIAQYLKYYFRKQGTDNSDYLAFDKGVKEKRKEEKKYSDEKRLREIEEAWDSILYGLILRSFVLITQSFLRKYILLPSLIITKNIIRILLFQNPEWSEDFRDWKKEVHIKCTYQGVPVSNKEFPQNWVKEGLQIRILSPFVLKPWHKSKSKVQSTQKKKRSTEKKNLEKKNFWYLTACGTQIESYLDNYFPNPFSFLGPILKKIDKQLKINLKNSFFRVIPILNERFLTILKEIGKWNIKSILFVFQNRFESSESKKNSTINKNNSKNNPMIYESPVLTQSINWTNSSFAEKRIRDLNLKTMIIKKQTEKMTQEKNGEVITSEKFLNYGNLTFYEMESDPIFELQKNIFLIFFGSDPRLKLLKNIFRIFRRINVRLTRKSYPFFKIFMERLYTDILLWMIRIPRINVQLFLESTKKGVNKYISKKKTNVERIDKTNQSIIPFMSIIQKSCNITNMNSQNSCDVSSLSQAYVFFKLSQTPVINVYNYKLRSIFESHERSFFLKNEIKDYFFRIQGKGIFNSKFRHKNLSDSVMTQWTNWLKIHYQYDLPKSKWSRLEPQNWRNRINEHLVAQNKDLIEYDSDEKTRLILYKKQQLDLDLDLLQLKKKIKKQYGYDLLSYKYINYADNQKSYIYGYRSPFQANKNRAISYNDNTRKKEFLDITGDISIQNYIAEDVIIDREKNLDRKYFNWKVMGVEIQKKEMGVEIQNKEMGVENEMGVEIQNHSISNPKFWFFSKLWIFYDVYKKNPWIIPIKSLFFSFCGNDFELDRAKAEYASRLAFLSNNNDENAIDIDLYRNDLKGERNFLLEKYLSFHLNYHSFLQETIMNNIQLFCLMIRLKNLKKFFIISIQKGELNLDTMAIQTHTDFPLTRFKDPSELIEKQIFFIEPVRLSRKNYEQFFMYQTARLLLIHKTKKRTIFQRNPEKSRLDKNHYDLLVPENILSSRSRRELRILMCFNPRKTVHRNTINDNESKIYNSGQVLPKKKDIDGETKKLMNLKFFLWPNYRLEDLACLNRYWFDTHNGSRFSILRIRMYPRLKI